MMISYDDDIDANCIDNDGYDNNDNVIWSFPWY